MKICFPVDSNEGLNSEIYNHFGSASSFIIFDTKLNSFEVVSNKDLGHQHGNCSPIKALDGKSVDSIVVGGIGAGAINKLNNMGIKVYKAATASIGANIKLLENNEILELGSKGACSGHSTNDCSH